MKIDVFFTAAEAERHDFADRFAAVVDVLRATTTIVAALEAGARRIYPVPTVERALELAVVTEEVILAGERGGFRIEGFDFGNSPVELSSAKLSGRDLVLTTTNGTRAVEAARKARVLIAASLTNAAAASKHLAEEARGAGKNRGEVAIVCSGTDGAFSIEDVYVAGLIVGNLASEAEEISDSASAAWKLSQRPLTEVVNRSSCRHMRVLLEKGFGEDIDFAFRLDASRTVPRYLDGAFEVGGT